MSDYIDIESRIVTIEDACKALGVTPHRGPLRVACERIVALEAALSNLVAQCTDVYPVEGAERLDWRPQAPSREDLDRALALLAAPEPAQESEEDAGAAVGGPFKQVAQRAKDQGDAGTDITESLLQRIEHLAAERERFRSALERAEVALAKCYDVVGFPADEISEQSEALRAARKALGGGA